MGREDSRDVALILCRPDGDLLGTTEVFEVASPYPQEIGALVASARLQLGIAPTVLRVLETTRRPYGDRDLVTYLAEVDEPISTPLAPTARYASFDEAVAAPEPFRMPWAEPGGPARHLAWAAGRLDAAGIRTTGDAQQMRTWNLSSVWRLPTDRGDVWLKAVPPFFSHEGAVIERLSRYSVPHLLARSDGIMLLAEVPGADLYEPTPTQALVMIDLLLAIQLDSVDHLDELVALGLPDWRLPALGDGATRILDAWSDQLESGERRVILDLIDGLDERHRRLQECGLPDTLVHGDFHGGNFRGTALEMTLLDWGDSGVGHPLLDMAAFIQRMPRALSRLAREHWITALNERFPGSDARRAARLLAPVAALRQAIVYQYFLEHIEPSERFYHRDDPADWLQRTAALLTAPSE